MYGDMNALSPWTRPDRLRAMAAELGAVADAYDLRNPPLARAFRAVEGFARRRLEGPLETPLPHH